MDIQDLKKNRNGMPNRRKLPNRTPCSITKVLRNNEKFYVIVDYDPKTYEPRGVFCHGPKPGCELWALIHEVCPLICRVIQTSQNPENIGRTIMRSPKYSISVIGSIIDIFQKEYKEWLNAYK